MRCDQILVMDQGRVVERGTHLGLLDQNGRYAALWNAQVQATGAGTGAVEPVQGTGAGTGSVESGEVSETAATGESAPEKPDQ